jgi:hypothetical protein
VWCFSGTLVSAVDVFPETLVSAVDRRAYFLLLRQKKVAKEKATPGYAVGFADFPALLEGPGGCGTRGYAPQTVLADCPRPFSVARRSTRGPEGRRGTTGTEISSLLRSTPKKWQKPNPDFASAPAVFPGPLRGAEQHRVVGGFRLALSEPKASLASRPTTRVAQGTGVAGTDPGVPFSLATFFWANKRKYARRQGGTRRIRKLARASGAETNASENKSTHQAHNLR